MQMEKHVQVLAILHIVYSSISLVAGGIAFLIFFGTGLFLEGVNDINSGGVNVPAIIFTVGLVITTFLVVLSIPGIVGGIGLLKHKEWARILVLVIGFIDLLHIPLGTLLGIYTIWTLMNADAIKLFAPAAVTVVQQSDVHP
jgi:hypothetical protein